MQTSFKKSVLVRLEVFGFAERINISPVLSEGLLVPSKSRGIPEFRVPSSRFSLEASSQKRLRRCQRLVRSHHSDRGVRRHHFSLTLEGRTLHRHKHIYGRHSLCRKY